MDDDPTPSHDDRTLPGWVPLADIPYGLLMARHIDVEERSTDHIPDIASIHDVGVIDPHAWVYDTAKAMGSDDLFNRALATTDNPPSMYVIREQARKVFGRIEASHPALEIGTRRGGSAFAVLAAILESDRRRALVTVDPYGDLPYRADLGETPWTYSNDLFREAMEGLAARVRACGLNWVHYMMRDVDYMECVWPRVPLYVQTPPLQRPTFAFVYLDGEHTEEAVRRQLSWLRGKVVEGGMILIDDADWLKDRGQPILEDFGGTSMERVGRGGLKKWLLIGGAGSGHS